jgi:hypothetical protein
LRLALTAAADGARGGGTVGDDLTGAEKALRCSCRHPRQVLAANAHARCRLLPAPLSIVDDLIHSTRFVHPHRTMAMRDDAVLFPLVFPLAPRASLLLALAATATVAVVYSLLSLARSSDGRSLRGATRGALRKSEFIFLGTLRGLWRLTPSARLLTRHLHQRKGLEHSSRDLQTKATHASSMRPSRCVHHLIRFIPRHGDGRMRIAR